MSSVEKLQWYLCREKGVVTWGSSPSTMRLSFKSNLARWVEHSKLSLVAIRIRSWMWTPTWTFWSSKQASLLGLSFTVQEFWLFKFPVCNWAFMNLLCEFLLFRTPAVFQFKSEVAINRILPTFNLPNKFLYYSLIHKTTSIFFLWYSRLDSTFSYCGLDWVYAEVVLLLLSYCSNAPPRSTTIFTSTSIDNTISIPAK